MERNEIVGLLSEIRDLQKLHLEKYTEALKNQQDAIALQRKASQLQRRSLLALLALVVLAIALAYLPELIRH
jgi:hypothetical protein